MASKSIYLSPIADILGKMTVENALKLNGGPAFCAGLIKEYRLQIREIPEDLRTEEMYLAAAVIGANVEIPTRFTSSERFCKKLVLEGGFGIMHIPEHMKTAKICRDAVAQSGSMLKYVPVNLRTRELCDIACANSSYAYKYVPQHLLTFDMKESAVVSGNLKISEIPFEQRTPKMYEACAKQGQIDEIPSNVLTAKMCMYYINYGGDLDKIPAIFKTREICERAFKYHARNIFNIPDEFVTREMYDSYSRYKMVAATDGSDERKYRELSKRFDSSQTRKASPPRKNSPPPAAARNASPPRNNSPPPAARKASPPRKNSPPPTARSSWAQIARR
jgi:hypothetical protein